MEDRQGLGGRRGDWVQQVHGAWGRWLEEPRVARPGGFAVGGAGHRTVRSFYGISRPECCNERRDPIVLSPCSTAIAATSCTGSSVGLGAIKELPSQAQDFSLTAPSPTLICSPAAVAEGRFRLQTVGALPTKNDGAKLHFLAADLFPAVTGGTHGG